MNQYVCSELFLGIVAVAVCEASPMSLSFSHRLCVARLSHACKQYPSIQQYSIVHFRTLRMLSAQCSTSHAHVRTQTQTLCWVFFQTISLRLDNGLTNTTKIHKYCVSLFCCLPCLSSFAIPHSFPMHLRYPLFQPSVRVYCMYYILCIEEASIDRQAI